MEYSKIQIRKDTQENWNKFNPVLADGELGIVSELNKFKIGDGITAFILLPFATMSVDELDTKLLELGNKVTTVESTVTQNTNDITAIKEAGYMTSDQVNELINGAGFVKTANLKTINGESITAEGGGDIEVKGGGVTMPEVEAKIAENTNGYQTSSDVESTIAGKNYVPQNSFATVNSQSITNGGNINIEAGGFEVVNTQLTLDENYYQDSVLTIEPNKIYKLTADPYDLYDFNLQLKHNGSFNGVAYLVWDDDECRIFDILGTYDNIEYFKVVGEIIGKNFQHYVEVVGVSGNAIINIDPIKEEEKVTVGSVNGISLATGANVNGFVERTIRVTADNSADNRILIGQEIKNNGNYLFKFNGTPSSDGKLYIEIYSGPGIGGFYMLQWSNNLKIKDIDVTYGKREINRKGSVKDISQLSGFEAHYAYVFPYEETIFFTDGLFDSAGGGVTMSEVEAKIAENTNGYQTSSDVESTIAGKNYVAKEGFATINQQSITDGGNIDVQGGFENVDVVLTKDPDSWGTEAILLIEPNKVYNLKTDETLNSIQFKLVLKYTDTFEGVSYILWDKKNKVDISRVEGYNISTWGKLSTRYSHSIDIVGVKDNVIANIDVEIPEFKTINGEDITGYGNINGFIEESIEVNENNGPDNRLVIGDGFNDGNYIFNISGRPNPDGKLYITIDENIYSFYIIKWTDNGLKIKDIDVTYGAYFYDPINRMGTVTDNTSSKEDLFHFAYVFPSDQAIIFTDGLFDSGGVTMADVEAKINENANGYQTAQNVEDTVNGKIKYVKGIPYEKYVDDIYIYLRNFSDILTEYDYGVISPLSDDKATTILIYGDVNQRGIFELGDFKNDLVIDCTNYFSVDPIEIKYVGPKYLKGNNKYIYTVTDGVVFVEKFNQEYVSMADVEAKGFATTAEIPTDNNQLANGKGYITDSDVTAKGYQTADDVNSIVDGKGFAKDATVEELSGASVELNFAGNKIYKLTDPFVTNLTVNGEVNTTTEMLVYFHSGETATVVTLDPSYKVMGDASKLEKNMDYILSIKDGYAVIAPVNAGGGITMLEVEEKIAENANGYQTADQVESAITGKGYTTIGEVETKGYQTAENVESVITGKGYQTADQVENTITGKGYQTAGDVDAKIAENTNGFAKADQIPTDNNQLANGAGYVTNANVEAKGYVTDSDVTAKGYQTAEQVTNTVNTKAVETESKIPKTTETWSFTMDDGTTIEKIIYIK